MINKIKGIGMVEVLVALVILSIAVLGFTALQLRAVRANQVALQTVQAMNIARDLAERMRVNKSQRAEYQAFANSSQAGNITTRNCQGSTICSAAEFARFDVRQVFGFAATQGFRVDVRGCGGALTRQCIFVAWDETIPNDSAVTTPGVVSTACTNQGVYIAGSSCVVLEAY